MLETTREFAIEQLAAGGEIVLVERAFEEYLESLAEAAAVGLKGPDQLLWLERLEVEHDNLRAAMGRALDRDDGATALGLALLLWEFWWIRGYRLEGRAWLERCLSLAGNTSERDRAAAEFALGRLSFDLGDYAVAEQHLGRSLQANRRLRDALAESEVLSMMAMIAVNRLDYGAARLFGEQALAISREAADLRRTATALRVLGMVAREQGEHDRALTLFEESMALG
jgi:tetratricopeptide (TPR) repeat protein